MDKKKRYMVTPTGRAADRIAAAVAEMRENGTALTDNAALITLLVLGLDTRDKATAHVPGRRS